MNKKIQIAKYAKQVLDASLRRALGKHGLELVRQKKAKVVYLDGEWWLLDQDYEKKDKVVK